MKKLLLLVVVLFGFTVTNPTVSHADIFGKGIKNNTSQAAKMPVPWEKDKHGDDMTLNVINTNQIPYYVDNSYPYVKQIKQAATAWNRLGVIKLVRVNDASQSEITFTVNQNQYQPHVMAETNMHFSHGDYTNASIDVNQQNFDSLGSDDSKSLVLQHEFGHALGFAHDNYMGYDHITNHKISLVMVADDDNRQSLGFMGLGFIEQRALVQHYHLAVQPGTNKNYAPADQ